MVFWAQTELHARAGCRLGNQPPLKKFVPSDIGRENKSPAKPIFRRVFRSSRAMGVCRLYPSGEPRIIITERLKRLYEIGRGPVRVIEAIQKPIGTERAGDGLGCP